MPPGGRYQDDRLRKAIDKKRSLMSRAVDEKAFDSDRNEHIKPRGLVKFLVSPTFRCDG